MRRTPMPPRTVPLPPGPPPGRGAGLARGGYLRRSGPPPAATAAVLLDVYRPAPPVAAARYAGPDRATRLAVLERDGYCCVCCGQSIIGRRYSLGHRLRASQGGRPVPSNLCTYLGWGGQGHHGRIDARLDPRDEARGYTVRSGGDPRATRVLYVREHGERWHWLADDGLLLDCGPAEDAA